MKASQLRGIVVCGAAAVFLHFYGYGSTAAAFFAFGAFSSAIAAEIPSGLGIMAAVLAACAAVYLGAAPILALGCALFAIMPFAMEALTKHREEAPAGEVSSDVRPPED
jgi:hypothetical protein